ncbi:MAG: hypothetical protein ACRCVH_06515 [Vagococcus fluvialis]|uniref:hypothetical protein n=1 Tax=Vagococcus fluvialis TaxID=2738 RepID=UPI000B74751D|nr:hypothetical protein [Vagococcus fluvialis]MBO0420535.1 hypothetical protein [Vagococcus fluvialis]OTP31582.1 hypothetical protein A5798_001605 [Enterococcus sp. 6C8_DIV0013]OTP31585.1 hypothetical protein A5798_001608 [Enterococcus sp. 6C8_DIV0013]
MILFLALLSLVGVSVVLKVISDESRKKRLNSLAKYREQENQEITTTARALIQKN